MTLARRIGRVRRPVQLRCGKVGLLSPACWRGLDAPSPISPRAAGRDRVSLCRRAALLGGVMPLVRHEEAPAVPARRRRALPRPDGPRAERETQRVDLELVLAVDVSLSMDTDEQRLQREGYVAAFRDPAVHRAIASGAGGRIAVTYIEWAGEHAQETVVPWTLIDGPPLRAPSPKSSPHPFARPHDLDLERDHLCGGAVRGQPLRGASPRHRHFGRRAQQRRPAVAAAREEALASGIVINGLPILAKEDRFRGSSTSRGSTTITVSASLAARAPSWCRSPRARSSRPPSARS